MKANPNLFTLNSMISILVIFGLTSYLIYKYYIKLILKTKTFFTENFTTIKTPIMCDDNSCGMGCKKPDGINDTCPTTIYKDVDGKCHRKCPFSCPNKLDSCKQDECCVGCGYSKISVPCELDNMHDDNDIKNDKYEYDPDIDPLPHMNKTKTMHTNTKTDNLTMTYVDEDKNEYDSFYKGWSPFVKKWPCDMNVTGTFTECGPSAYNSCGK